MVEHLDDNAASEFVSGSLPPSAVGKVEGHLASCRDCRALVAALAADSGEDSNARTFLHERISASQAGWLPGKTLAIGDRVGRYLVLSSLGAGGMGVVFAAYDPNLGRKIALKLLRSGLAGSSKDARNRLRREAQAIAQLSHPNVVSVYDVGTTDGGDLYIAMEFVEGDTLTSWLKKYPRTWREIIDVFVQAARGLASAHGVGLLHRDFKPDNVLVGGDGRVRVTDFGLARSLLAPEETAYGKPVMTALNLALTATGTVLGTPRYMPPEQMTGPDLDARSDQFSFCVALYEALYGRHPLRDATSVQMAERGDRAQPPPEGTKVPQAIGSAVLRGLERERGKRFPSMSSLIDELVPRPRRAPVRYAVLAIVGFLAVGAATAAVLANQPAAVPAASETSGPPQLVEELHQMKLEREALLRRLEQARVDQRELEWLRGELARKDDEIQRLTDEVGLQILAPEGVARKPAKMSLATSQMVTTAIGAVQGPVDGCFREWAERTPGAYDAHFEATMVVGLTVTPDGFGTLPRIVSTPDAHTAMPAAGKRGLSMLEHCVSEQVARAKFTPGSAQLEIDTTVVWSSRRVRLSPKMVGQHQVPRGQIELQ